MSYISKDCPNTKWYLENPRCTIQDKENKPIEKQYALLACQLFKRYVLDKTQISTQRNIKAVELVQNPDGSHHFRLHAQNSDQIQDMPIGILSINDRELFEIIDKTLSLIILPSQQPISEPESHFDAMDLDEPKKKSRYPNIDKDIREINDFKTMYAFLNKCKEMKCELDEKKMLALRIFLKSDIEYILSNLEESIYSKASKISHRIFAIFGSTLNLEEPFVVEHKDLIFNLFLKIFKQNIPAIDKNILALLEGFAMHAGAFRREKEFLECFENLKKIAGKEILPLLINLGRMQTENSQKLLIEMTKDNEWRATASNSQKIFLSMALSTAKVSLHKPYFQILGDVYKTLPDSILCKFSFRPEEQYLPIMPQGCLIALSTNDKGIRGLIDFLFQNVNNAVKLYFTQESAKQGLDLGENIIFISSEEYNDFLRLGRVLFAEEGHDLLLRGIPKSIIRRIMIGNSGVSLEAQQDLQKLIGDQDSKKLVKGFFERSLNELDSSELDMARELLQIPVVVPSATRKITTSLSCLIKIYGAESDMPKMISEAEFVDFNIPFKLAQATREELAFLELLKDAANPDIFAEFWNKDAD